MTMKYETHEPMQFAGGGEAYRDGWERTFGRSIPKCDVCGESLGELCGHGDARNPEGQYTGKYYCRAHCPTGVCADKCRRGEHFESGTSGKCLYCGVALNRRSVLAAYAAEHGLRLNPDERVVGGVLKGLEKRDGLCPCRLALTPEQREKIRCPCEMHMREIEESGHCKCHLFVRDAP